MMRQGRTNTPASTGTAPLGTAVLCICLAAVVVVTGAGAAMLASRVPQLDTPLGPDPATPAPPRIAP